MIPKCNPKIIGEVTYCSNYNKNGCTFDCGYASRRLQDEGKVFEFPQVRPSEDLGLSQRINSGLFISPDGQRLNELNLPPRSWQL